MKKIFLDQKLAFRLCALFVLLICLFLVSARDTPVQQAMISPPLAQQPKFAPKIAARSQPDSPLAITSIQITDQAIPDIPNTEFGFYVVNASSKAIAAFAIKQDIVANGAASGGGVSLYHLLLSNSSLRSGNSRLIPDTVDESSANNTIVYLSVDFVQFADGTTWGADSGRSLERVLGQRSAVELLSEELLNTLNADKDIPRAIEDSAANLHYPQDHSETWKAGFNSALRLLVDRLKRANEKGGFMVVENDLRSLKETFRRKD